MFQQDDTFLYSILFPVSIDYIEMLKFILLC
jgi:hypothetical protein